MPKQPVERRARTFRLKETACLKLEAMAKKQKKSQTWILETLILNAGDPSDDAAILRVEDADAIVPYKRGAQSKLVMTSEGVKREKADLRKERREALEELRAKQAKIDTGAAIGGVKRQQAIPKPAWKRE